MTEIIKNPDTTIDVMIYSWNCLKVENDMALAVLDEKRLVLLPTISIRPSHNRWRLIPNLTQGALTGGYTLFNPGVNLCVELPPVRNAINLSPYDPAVYGSALYCWTLRPVGVTSGEEQEQLWAIQDSRRGPSMDAKGSCNAESEVFLMDFSTANDNQKWVIRRV